MGTPISSLHHSPLINCKPQDRRGSAYVLRGLAHSGCAVNTCRMTEGLCGAPRNLPAPTGVSVHGPPEPSPCSFHGVCHQCDLGTAGEVGRRGVLGLPEEMVMAVSPVPGTWAVGPWISTGLRLLLSSLSGDQALVPTLAASSQAGRWGCSGQLRAPHRGSLPADHSKSFLMVGTSRSQS